MYLQLPGGKLLFESDPVTQTSTTEAGSVYFDDAFTGSEDTDRTAEFQAALSAAGAAGGGSVRYRGNHRLLGDITIPENVALVGPVAVAGQIGHLGEGAADYERKPGGLRLASTATIRVSASARLRDVVVVRDGLDAPFTSVAQAQAGIAAFAGTAVTIVGNDARVTNALFLGFQYAIKSHNCARGRFTDVQGDCTNGIRISACYDIPYLTRCHFWPFLTANYTWTAADTTQGILTRSGIGIELLNTVDWGRVSHCFTYGYFRGFRVADAHANLLTACAADGPVVNGNPVQAGAIGLLIEGSCLETKVTDFTAAGKAQGIFAGTAAGCFTELAGCNNVACDIGINVRDGDVQILGGQDRVVKYGLQVQSATSKVTVLRKMRQVAMANTNLANPANVQIIGTLT